MKSSRIHRLLKSITLLQTGQPFLADDLAREINVSRRTVFRDLNMLKMAGIPIKFNSTDRKYTIEKSFFLPPINFTLGEVLSLMMAAQQAAKPKTLPDRDELGAAMLKIESILPSEIRTHCGSALDRIEFRAPPMSDIQTNTDIFHNLWQAAQDREELVLLYESYFEHNDIDIPFHPYRLVFMARGWYVIGYSKLHDETRTLKIERIIMAKPTGHRFVVEPEFNLESYFGNAWQMIRGDQRYHVRVRFSPKVAGNIEEVIWHSTQRTNHLDDGSLHFEVDVDGLGEIMWWILGYGKEAVVEEPVELQEMIRQQVEEMARLYPHPS